MAFLIQQNPQLQVPSSKYSNEDVDEVTAAPGTGNVSSQLLVSSGESAALDKGEVLRRIRHQRRANKIRNALQLLTKEPNVDEMNANSCWLDNGFYSP